MNVPMKYDFSSPFFIAFSGLLCWPAWHVRLGRTLPAFSARLDGGSIAQTLGLCHVPASVEAGNATQREGFE